ncbi:MAG: winged helix-turn-helix transcriptional regulator [Cytophagales bacterium]|nr:winged helix-turn-helix transcriptional regulator [Cytophagales bacterium]
MTPEKLKEIIQQGEGIEVEFKTSRSQLSENAFESVCAFLNRQGGHLILGVKNDGTAQGVDDGRVQDVINSIVTNANNPQKLNPTFYLSPQVMDFEGKKVIYLYVPANSQVHSTAGRIFDRNEDGDFDITNKPEQVTQLYLRKQNSYSENKVFPYVELSDFKQELFTRVRALARSENTEHAWLEMSDEEILRSANLYQKDPITSKEGYTLAAVLLLGNDQTIIAALPHHKTDAILRVENLDRYDDRDDIRTNLIESYDRLMAFIKKHLQDKFYQEGVQRISIRDRIFREVVSNLLIHREFTNAFPAKLIIEKDRVLTENWNRPHGAGAIDPANFSPFPKNPNIAKFFKEIGRVDELGSGIRNTFKYCGIYTAGTKPEFIEGDVFKTIIPLKAEKATTQKTTQKTTQITTQNTPERIIELLTENPALSRKELADILGDITEDGVKYHLEKLKEEGKIERIGRTRGYWKVMQ